MEVTRVREEGCQLDGQVELDDAYLGGERSGGKTGRGSENKVLFVAAVQTTPGGRPQFVRLRQQPRMPEEVSAFAARSIAPSATVISDGLWCFAQCRSSWPTVRLWPLAVARPAQAAAIHGGQHVLRQPQKFLERHASRVRFRQVRSSLPRRGPTSIQSSLHSAPHLASPDARRLPFHSCSGARRSCG